MNTLLLMLATAVMIGAAIYLGHQGIVMRRANKIIAGVVDTLTANPPIASFDAVAAAGDRLAHELLYREHPDLLARWWELRGGHDQCTVCKPGATVQRCQAKSVTDGSQCIGPLGHEGPHGFAAGDAPP